MKQLLFLSGIFASLVCVSLAQSQSLADMAHQAQQNRKTATRIYTNDNLPTTGALNIVGIEAPAAAAPAATAAEASTDNAVAPARAANDKGEANAAPEGEKKPQAGLKEEAAGLKKQVTDLEHELDLLDREFRLRAATYYADAGNSLRNPQQWAEQQRQHQTRTAEKKKALESAKQKLDSIQAEARRAGVSLEY